MFPHYGELRPTNGWDRLAGFGHPSKFQRVSRLAFVTAARSLTVGQPNLARCLAVSGAGTLYIHFWGLLPPDGILPCAKFNLHPSCIILYWQRYCTTLEQQASSKICGVLKGMELRNFNIGRHLYSAGRPSRWASAHILVITISLKIVTLIYTSPPVKANTPVNLGLLYIYAEPFTVFLLQLNLWFVYISGLVGFTGQPGFTGATGPAGEPGRRRKRQAGCPGEWVISAMSCRKTLPVY